MTQERILILNNKQVTQKIKRIAYEIYEHNFEEKEIVFAGIYDKGYILAGLLKDALEKISPITCQLVKITLDKTSLFQSEIAVDCELKSLRKKVVVLVDDVLNSGRTMVYSLKPFLNTEIKKLQTATLVDRNHKTFPIKADYVGYSLSTTLQDHIDVRFEKEEILVYLH